MNEVYAMNGDKRQQTFPMNVNECNNFLSKRKDKMNIVNLKVNFKKFTYSFYSSLVLFLSTMYIFLDYILMSYSCSKNGKILQ